MGYKTFDYPWAAELYNEQWEYPYVLDVAHTPESFNLDTGTPQEMQNRDNTTQTSSPAQTTAQPAQTGPGPVQQTVSPPPPMPVNNIGSITNNVKPFVVPALIVVAGIVIYNFLKKKKQ